MPVTRDQVLETLSKLTLPDGGTLVSRDMIRALTVDGDRVNWVIEVDPAQGKAMEPVREAAERLVAALPGVGKVSSVLTAHAAPKPKAPPPDLKIGRHATPQAGPEPIPGVASVIAVASGKGGVGKSTVSSNLAVALAKAGRRVGLLDADIYGPSQHRMMGNAERAKSPDGKTLIPAQAHGVKMISMGMMMPEDQAVVWRGPMLMGALQQLLGQTDWGELDVLVVDLPPGTGDVQLTLTQKTVLAGAIVVSTPQDIALLDARKAIDMFGKTRTPILGLVENMSAYVCPECGHEAHLFGHGGVAAHAAKAGLPFLGAIPLSLDIRLAADAGTPVAAGEGPAAAAYAALAQALIDKGVA